MSALSISPSSNISVTGEVNVPYSQQNTASGGIPPYYYLVFSGTLPSGTTLNATGVVSGIPTSPGSFSYQIEVFDALGDTAITATITATIVSALTITPSSNIYVTGEVNVPYSQQNTASGGVTPYTYSVFSGTLPFGTTLNATGLVSGIPTSPGTFSYQIRVGDVGGNTADTGTITATVIDNPSCFNHDTKILCLKNMEEQYVPIQNLRIGNLVKTHLHGYRKISCIGKGIMRNNINDWRNCMYKMEKTETNGLIEDLIVTGGHAILVDELTEEEKELQEKEDFSIKIDDKHLLLLGLSDKFIQMKDSNIYTYYHLVPENNGDDDQRFGIWANGVLTETPSKNQFMSHKYEDME